MSIERAQVLVWSRKIRLFHWVNVISVVLLTVTGLIIYNGKILGIATEGRVLLLKFRG